MTREEIIQGLYRGDSRAIKEAIKALEKEPCEDCISRQAVKNILPRQKFVGYESYLSCVADVDKLPTATPTRKKGKWINKSHKNGCGITFAISECTCCGKNTFFDCDELLYRYCPNCGAKMDEEVEEKEE